MGITVTTVGFGDYSPETKIGRAVGILWMLYGFVTWGTFLNAMTEYFFEQRAVKDFQSAGQFDEETFAKIDKNGDGILSRAEFRGFVLVKHGLVPQHVLDLIDEQFDNICDPGTDHVTLHQIQNSDPVRGTVART